MLRVLLLLLLCSLGLSRLQADPYSYIHIELVAPSNALLTEGLFARGPDATLAGSTTTPLSSDSDPMTLYGTVERNFYRGFGLEGYLPAYSPRQVLLTAAKDATFSFDATFDVADDGVIYVDSVALLVNSRERMSYDLDTDTFYYGTQAINFPRDPGFQIAFQYGGSFTYLAPDHFQILSASGVQTDFTILSIPEPAILGLLLAAVAGLLFFRVASDGRGLPSLQLGRSAGGG